MSVARNEKIVIPRIVGNTERVYAQLTDNDGVPIDLTGVTVTYRQVDLDDGTVTVSAGSCTVQPTTSVTATASTDLLTATKHGLKNGDEVVFTTTDTLPAGLATSTRYFVITALEDTFAVATTKHGTAVDITDTGTGTHAFAKLGVVYYSPDAADVDEAGLFAVYFADNSTPPRKWPFDGPRFRLQIVSETTIPV